MNTENEKRIEEIDAKVENIKNMLGKITNQVLIEKTEQEWAELEQEKEYLIRLNNDNHLAENDIEILFDKIKTLLTNPVAIRNL